MILHTVLPEEFVLAGLDYGAGGPAAEAGAPITGQPGPGSPGTREMLAGGRTGPVRLLLERDASGVWRVSRLLSSDPHDYMNPAFSPGAAAPPA